MPLKSHRKSSGSIVYLWLPVIVWDLSTLRTANVNTLPSPAQHAPLMCLRHMALYDKGVLIDWLIENVTVGIMWIYVFGLTKPKKNGFYRVTLCVSPVFAVARCPSVRPSVCLSVCLSRSLDPHGWRYRQTSCSDRLPHHASFWLPAQFPISRGTPSSGAQNTPGVKILRFSTEIAVWLGHDTR